jgi:hypothetical protein
MSEKGAPLEPFARGLVFYKQVAPMAPSLFKTGVCFYKNKFAQRCRCPIRFCQTRPANE